MSVESKPFSDPTLTVIAPLVDHILAKDDIQSYLKSNLENAIAKIEEYIKENDSFSDAGNSYIRSLTVRIVLNANGLRIRHQRYGDNYNAMFCVKTLDLQGLKYLVYNEVEVNEQDRRGWTALHYAVVHERIDFIGVLLAHPNIDLTLKTIKDMTPRDLALKTENPDIIKLFS